MTNRTSKQCKDCSTSQQIKCFGIKQVNQGIGKNRRCNKPKKQKTYVDSRQESNP